MNKRRLEKTVRWILYVMLTVTVLTALIALVDKRTGSETPAADVPVSEAPVGSFESTAFNEGWVMTEGGKDRTITLPYRAASIDSKELTIRNTLPSDLKDGMSLITFSSMADIYIRINGVLRESYSSETMKNMPYFIPSAYNVVELTREDAGKEISITVVPKASINLNEVYFGYGNNVWFRIVRNHVAKIAIALVVIILGIILAIISKIMQRISASAGTGFFLGLFMVDFATWIFSESELRQLIFQRPSMSQYFSYLAMELFAPLAATYFDAVQDKRHHRAYSFIITLSTLQIIVNVVLHFTGLLEFYQTLPASHMWLAIGIILTAVNVIRDIHSGMIRQYLATAIGMIILLFAGVFELVLFYKVRFYSIGIVSSLGLIFLAAATLVQNLMDQIRIARQREEEHSRMVINTIESIAVAIDAKDEYTGGHSERVGYYAAILAKNMAADWGFTDEDIQRIHYIGLLHDIGKMGVADSVLNKQGRLNDDEYSLMKKHAEVGSEILSGMDMDIRGLSDGIRHHHERYDGTGYPDGMSGSEIPLVARILCLADSYDAMTSDRVYRRRLSDQDVRKEFVRSSGSQFDPAITKIFINLLDRGIIHPVTIQGMAAKRDGSLLKSALLEKRMLELTETGTHIDHPDYIRMISFLIKLDEKKNRNVDIFLLTFQEKAELSEIKSRLSMKDLCIALDDRFAIVTLSGKTPEYVSQFEEFLQHLEKVSVERI